MSDMELITLERNMTMDTQDFLPKLRFSTGQLHNFGIQLVLED